MFAKKPTTVDAAIAPLRRAIMDLEGVANARNEALARNSELISGLETQMGLDQVELTRAEAVAKMIKTITEPALDPIAA